VRTVVRDSCGRRWARISGIVASPSDFPAAHLPTTLKLKRAFYDRPTLTIARELIGTHLVRYDGSRLRVGRIVETEAYQGPEDLAAHSSRGRTARTAVMFGPPGHAYVYLIYGFWNCLNVVTEEEGTPHAVLLRALEPVGGIADKTWGPGLLCRALSIDRALNGTDLCGDVLWIERAPGKYSPPRVGGSPRNGVDYAGGWAARPWRFFDRDSPYVSTVSDPQRRRRLKLMQPPGSPAKTR
jgi:DNA-3-methyladenine glycosylase